MNYGTNAVKYEYQSQRFILADGTFLLDLLEDKEKKAL